jgi:hypothetical protein
MAKKKQNLPSWASKDVRADPFEEAIADNIKDVVAELCLADMSILISYIDKELHPNIEDLINSSAELFFKEGTLHYGHAASVTFEWGQSPTVTLDMEFIHNSVSVFFKLVLNGLFFGVAVQRILLNERSDDLETDIRRFAATLSDARIVPLPARANP